MPILLVAPLALAADPPELAAELDRERARVADEIDRRRREAWSQPPPERERSLVEMRRVTFEAYARLAQRSGREDDALRALTAVVDLEQAEVAPTLERPCPAPTSTLGAAAAALADCLSAQVGRGVVFATESYPTTTFTAFVPEGAGIRIVSGRLEGSTLRLEDGVLRDDPLLVATVARLAAAGPVLRALESWVDADIESGARLDRFYEGWIVDARPLLPSDRVLCEPELPESSPGASALTSRRLDRPPLRLVDEELYSGRLWTRYAQQMPCRSGFVFSVDTGVRAGTRQRYPLGTGGPDLSPGSPFVEDGGGLTRTRVFGAVTVVERIPPGSYPPYGGACELRHAGGSMRVQSSYGCTVVLAAQLDSDSITDFVIHSGHESCEFDTLWMSTPTGWTGAGERGGCE